ncbi:MAG TPA: hypothetical protein VFS22_03360 [Flavisolibacter sp.]|nr:hypothetical protein [Flavisolibacter sp.]
MWFSAIANFKGGLAHYKIVRDNVGIFNAYLERYDGKPENSPTPNIILVRGLRHWSGSINEQGLLDSLGEVIDRKTRGRLYYTLSPEEKRERKGRDH